MARLNGVRTPETLAGLPTNNDRMDGEQFRAGLEAIGWTQAAYCAATGLTHRTITRYARTTAPIHDVLVLKLLQLCHIRHAKWARRLWPREHAQTVLRPALARFAALAEAKEWTPSDIAEALEHLARTYRDKAAAIPPARRGRGRPQEQAQFFDA